ncbi:sensor histidine kinase [Paenibacillus glucanolyticus]|jgi:two-component system sensor histidine kinase YesM|uniref:sensor histidine kinase n=1 Tax=Paenibacillus TaxID=44249 RepID=UPI0004ACF701|nr:MULTISPECIES: sensor histidine kinase [Paenibacillus]ANA81534.1 two-component sensor histidine kinase [Paenibacillus glucanolyticus]AVV59734.1 sensor histidine kinase [Paenibacillus glucanolyticus]
MMAMFRWIRDRFSQNIQTRLTGYFLLILLPLVIISLFAVERSRAILYEQAVERTEMALSSAMNHFDLALQNVEEISSLISGDLRMNELLNKNSTNFSPQSIVDFSYILDQLSDFVSVNRYVSQITVYHQASNMFISTHYGGKRLTGETQQEWLVEAARRNGTGISYVMSEYPVAEGVSFGQMTNTDSISLIRAMDLYNGERQSNLLVVSFSESKLLNIIKTLLPSENSRIALLNEKGEVVVETGRVYEEEISDKEMTVTIDSDYSTWRLELVQPKSELYKETDQLRLFTVAIIVLSVLLAIIISWVVYSGIASPVLKLARGMKRLSSGELNIHVDTKRKDEFGFLIQSFNKMAVVQKHLIEDHYEQQLRLTTTELKFLQSQINPHFLYNTLDSIYWTAKNYDADEISEMVMNLSKFFRLSLNKGRQVFTIEESITHLHYYLRIQQLRFMDNFTVDYQISEDSKRVPLLKLLLQPLVENAIIHGMEGKSSGGCLKISSCIEKGNTVVISVQDNGPGIGEERLRYIQHELTMMGSRSVPASSQDEENVKDLFGLRNVFSRMKLYYGREANLTVHSVSGEGTTVTISIPLDRCKEVNMEL